MRWNPAREWIEQSGAVVVERLMTGSEATCWRNNYFALAGLVGGCVWCVLIVSLRPGYTLSIRAAGRRKSCH